MNRNTSFSPDWAMKLGRGTEVAKKSAMKSMKMKGMGKKGAKGKGKNC